MHSLALARRMSVIDIVWVIQFLVRLVHEERPSEAIVGEQLPALGHKAYYGGVYIGRLARSRQVGRLDCLGALNDAWRRAGRFACACSMHLPSSLDLLALVKRSPSQPFGLFAHRGAPVSWQLNLRVFAIAFDKKVGPKGLVSIDHEDDADLAGGLEDLVDSGGEIRDEVFGPDLAGDAARLGELHSGELNTC